MRGGGEEEGGGGVHKEEEEDELEEEVWILRGSLGFKPANRKKSLILQIEHKF